MFNNGLPHVMDAAGFMPALTTQAFSIGRSLFNLVAPASLTQSPGGLPAIAQQALAGLAGLPAKGEQLGLEGLRQWVTFLTRSA